MQTSFIIYGFLSFFLPWVDAVFSTPTKTSTAAIAVHTYSLHWPLTPINTTRYEYHHEVQNGVSTTITNVTSIEPVLGVTTDIGKRSSADVALIVTSLAQSAWATTVLLCIVSGIGTAGLPCIAALITACISTIWGYFIVSEALGPTLSNRAEQNIVWEFHHDYHSTDDCGTLCQLQTKSGQATWTHFANVTVDGQKHKMHYWQKDSLRGLRVQQLQNNLARRAPQPQGTIYLETGYAQEGQLIGTVYWVSDSEQAKDELASDDIQTIANDFASYTVENSMSMGCLDVGDSDGTVFQSVVLMNDADEVWELAHDDIEPTLNTCYVQDPYSTAPQ